MTSSLIFTHLREGCPSIISYWQILETVSTYLLFYIFSSKCSLISVFCYLFKVDSMEKVFLCCRMKTCLVLWPSPDLEGTEKSDGLLEIHAILTQKLDCQDSYSKRYFNLYLKYGFLPVSQMKVVSSRDDFEEDVVLALFNFLL